METYENEPRRLGRGSKASHGPRRKQRELRLRATWAAASDSGHPCSQMLGIRVRGSGACVCRSVTPHRVNSPRRATPMFACSCHRRLSDHRRDVRGIAGCLRAGLLHAILRQMHCLCCACGSRGCPWRGTGVSAREVRTRHGTPTRWSRSLKSRHVERLSTAGRHAPALMPDHHTPVRRRRSS
jgi:hypothetical protein